jgi:hypothetical protein
MCCTASDLHGLNAYSCVPVFFCVVLTDDDEDSVDPDLACVLCHQSNDDAHMLLCDECGLGYHLACMGRNDMPEQEVWVCPCCQDMLDAIRRSAGQPF